MFSPLEDFTIFLHGPSGAGKGELYRCLRDIYRRHGYAVIYASSGDLFRAVYDDPAIAEQLRLGRYLNTLRPIMPQMQAYYRQFIRTWSMKRGQAVFILDGVVRRTTFLDERGKRIPSQVRQIATGFHHENVRLGGTEGCYVNELLAGETFQLSRTRRVTATSNSIRRSHHILLDTTAEDAEYQIRVRVEADLAALSDRLQKLQSGPNGVDEQSQIVLMVIKELLGVVQGAVCEPCAAASLQGETREQESDQRREWDSDKVDTLRRTLARVAGVPGSASFSTSCKALGVSTDIRDEDISPQSRQARIANYIRVHNGEQGPKYVLGFAAQALIKEFGFIFQPNGTFTVREGTSHKRCRVIANGAQRGVDLVRFRSSCHAVAEQIFEQSEQKRTSLAVSKLSNVI